MTWKTFDDIPDCLAKRAAEETKMFLLSVATVQGLSPKTPPEQPSIVGLFADSLTPGEREGLYHLASLAGFEIYEDHLKTYGGSNPSQGMGVEQDQVLRAKAFETLTDYLDGAEPEIADIEKYIRDLTAIMPISEDTARVLVYAFMNDKAGGAS